MHPFFLIALTDGLTFGSPAWIWALLLLGPLGWFFIEANRKRGVLLSKILAPRLQSQLAGRVSPLKRNLRMVSLLAAIACVILGLAKPRLGYRELEIKAKGRDVIIAIDTSRSMLSTDTVPTRLGRAKLIAQDLLTLLKGDRVGLIAFAGNAFLQAPLTLDKGAVLTSLEDLDTNTIPKGGTDIASAIRMAMEAFGRGEGSSRALVLMTDGEELEASAVAAAKEAAAAGVRIFTIGFGSPAGSLIPIISDSGQHDFVRDDGGRPVTSKMDASRLTEVAKETGGFYQPYGQDAAKIIYEKGIVPIEEQERGMLSSRKPIERYAWPVGAALLFLAFWSLLGEGRAGFGGGGGRGLSTREAVAIIALALSFSPGALSASGLSDYRQGNYQGALQDIERRLQSGATAAEIKFDAGAAAYKAGDFKKAAGYFSEAMTSQKQKIKEAATYNLANALVRSGEAAQESEAKLSEWKNALQHYETVLKASPANAQAKENRDIVLKLIEDQKKKQDQKKDKKEQQKDQSEKNKDQDKKDKDQQKSEQSQDDGGGQKDSKGQDDQKDQNKDQQQKSDQQKGGENGKDQQKQDPPKSGQGASQNQKDSQNQKQQGQASPTPSPSASPKEDGKGDQGPEQQQGQQGNQGGQPTPAPSAPPKKEGSLGGGEQGEKKEQQGDEGSVAEAEEGKDGKMSANQARALLRSDQDEEQQELNQQHRAVEQTLRDW
ncbi:MAG: VWA domain-containing protein [Verrucomicrobia bacterium]|nr:VWA domain-containing protein [Verrucomicrobiota bacterium]